MYIYLYLSIIVRVNQFFKHLPQNGDVTNFIPE
jgi:hypothetical protein